MTAWSLLIALMIPGLASAADIIETSWTGAGPYDDWNLPANWVSNAVPNDSFLSSYNVTLNYVGAYDISLSTASTISNLSFLSGGLFIDASSPLHGSLTVKNQTSFPTVGVARITTFYPGATVDLGTVPQFSTGVFDHLSYNGAWGGTLKWKDADVRTIGQDAFLAGSVIDSVSGLSALRNLQQVDGELRLSSTQDFAQGLTIGSTGTVAFSTATFSADHLVNHGSLSLSSPLNIAGSLSNTGTISVDTGGSLTATGTLDQQAGDGTLTAGIFVLKSGTVRWSGADIHTIGSAASIEVRNSTALTDTDTGLGALRNLSRVDGMLTVANSSTGVALGSPLIIGTNGRVTVGETGIISSPGLIADGELELLGKTALGGSQPGRFVSTGDATFNAGGQLAIKFTGSINPNVPTFDLSAGRLEVGGTAFLDGTLTLDFDLVSVTAPGIVLDASVTFILVDAQLTSGYFSNADDGNRIFVTRNGQNVGTFAVHYQSGNVTVSDFQASPVPEPATIVLLCGAGLILLGLQRRRHRE